MYPTIQQPRVILQIFVQGGHDNWAFPVTQLLKELACLPFFDSVHTKLKGVTVLSISNQRGSPPSEVKPAGEKVALLPLPDSRWHWRSHSLRNWQKLPEGNAPDNPGTGQSRRQ